MSDGEEMAIINLRQNVKRSGRAAIR